MEATGTNTVGGGGGIQFDTSASNNASNNGLYLAQISGERSSSDDGSNRLVFKTSRAGANGDGSVLHGPGTRMTIDESGRVSISSLADASNSNEGAQLRVRGAALTRNQYYSPAGDYFGSFGYTDNTYTKSWIAVDSSYNKTSAVSSGIFLSAFHLDATGSACGHTIKNVRTDAGGLIFSAVHTASSTGNPAVESQRLRITTDGNIIVGDFTPVDDRNTGGIHIRDSKGISFKSNSSQSVSRNWRIRNDDYGWGNLDFSVGDSVSDWGNSAADVLLSLTSNRRVGINATVPQQKLDVVGFGFTSAVFRPDTSSASVYGNTGSVNNLIQLRMPYGANAANASNSGALWGIKFQGRNDGAGYSNNDKSASIYAVSEDSLGYNRRVGLAFYTSSFDADQVERLRISNTGTIIKGSTNSANSQQPVQLFFNKRGSQIGKRVHQGSGGTSTAHNLLTISSFQSSNTRFFAYVTVHYVNPIANFGGRMETYAAANYGGTKTIGTFAVADGGRWGNPGGTLSLQWSGNTLQLNTYNNAYMEYSVDITYVAYDGAVVVFS